MSFILDALRKSDAERQRAVTPGLSDVRYAARPIRRSLWLPILVLVLAANAVFLTVQWFGRKDASPGTEVPPVVQAPVGGNPPAAASATYPPPPADIRPLAREAESPGAGLDTADVESEFGALPGQATNAVPAPVIAESAEAPLPVAAAPEPLPVQPGAHPSRIIAGNDLPTAEQLMGAGTLNIPVLNLDLHVYSEKATGRFVVINSAKYKEGGRLREGPTVDSITKDGVVLAYQGQRFTLSRK
ncbi:MAG: general secretion pathway protein GspB [Gammaproteobacteria bacterium]